MKGMADYVLQWFPAFFLGAVYGKVMYLTGSARSLGNALVKLIGPPASRWQQWLSPAC